MMKRFLLPLLIISICSAQENASHILHGLFYDDNLNFVRYGSMNLDTKQLKIINSLNIDEIGNPQKDKYGVIPLTYDPTNDIIYISAPNSENRPILSAINATTGVILSKLTSMNNSIISLQYDIFQQELFAHIETDEENTTEIIQIDPNDGKIKQVLGRILRAKATHLSSYCPICRKYFLFVEQNNSFVYIGVNSTEGGGISWQTPINIHPIDIKFSYKTFTMYTLYLNQTDRFFYIGILNRTIASIGEILAKITDDRTINVTVPAAYDVAQNIFYSFTLSTSEMTKGISYVNLNTSDVKSINLGKEKFTPYGWFVKQFVH